MKNYLNQADRDNLMIVYGVTENIEQLINSGLLSSEETTRLKTVKTSTERAIMGVLNRLGDTEKRKIVRSAQCNEIVVQGKYQARQGLVSHIAVEDMRDSINEYLALQCLDCKRCDFKNCGAYKMASACDVPLRADDGKGCPFRSEVSADIDEVLSEIKYS